MQKLKLAEEEAQEYQAYLTKLEDETEDESRVWELERELAGLQMEEEKLQLNLKSLKEDQSNAEADLQVILNLVWQMAIAGLKTKILVEEPISYSLLRPNFTLSENVLQS